MSEFTFDPKRYEGLDEIHGGARKRLYEDAPALLAYAVEVTRQRDALLAAARDAAEVLDGMRVYLAQMPQERHRTSLSLLRSAIRDAEKGGAA